jgi:mono/diheme cytochrome c family protein
MVNEAVEIGQREFADDAVGAVEPPEEREHMTAFQENIDKGQYTKEALFRVGDTFFSREFSSLDGYGAGPDERLRRVHSGVRGGKDTHSCAGCHTVGGLDGAGSETQRAFLDGDGDRISSSLVRNAPQVFGAGFVQAVALEMTQELGHLVDTATIDAGSRNAPVTIELVTKGIHFGSVVVYPGGAVDTRGVNGISTDLVVRPFGWKGNVERLRRFAEDAARVHFGVQSTVLADGYKLTPDPEHLGPGPNWFDPDNDGASRELEEGTLTASGVYMTMLESPTILPPFDPGLRERWGRGSARFDDIGCASCHTRELPLYGPSWREMPDTTNGPGVEVSLIDDGDFPKSSPSVRLFSDLKRHDMGKALSDSRDGPDGIPAAVFLTRPLWGLAESTPYLHDARAATIPEAILAHDGEAKAARDAFAALSSDAQADLHVFLLSLTRAQKVRVVR